MDIRTWLSDKTSKTVHAVKESSTISLVVLYAGMILVTGACVALVVKEYFSTKE